MQSSHARTSSPPHHSSTSQQEEHAELSHAPLSSTRPTTTASCRAGPRSDLALPPVPRRAAPRRLPARLALLPGTTHVARVVNDAVASAPPLLPRTRPRRCPIRDVTARTARHLAVPPSPAITELLRARQCQPLAGCHPLASGL
jgi:hypothetical protein